MQRQPKKRVWICQPSGSNQFFLSKVLGAVYSDACLRAMDAGNVACQPQAEENDRLMKTRAAKTVASEIENWLQRFAKAYSRKDLDAVMGLMDSGKPLLVLGSGPDEKRFTASQFKKGIHRDFSQVDKLSMSFDWIKTDAQGDVAWFASETKLAVTVCKQKTVHLFRFTGVLVKNNDQWLLRMGQMGLVAANQHAGESWPSKQ